jgi:hypothetical protein
MQSEPAVIEQGRTNSEDERSIRMVVGDFGHALKKVSLLDEAGVAQTIQKEYGSYLEPSLIADWQKNPQAALGRMTSSPWPERIDIDSLLRINENLYQVEGSIVEVTNEGGGIGESPAETGRRSATFLVARNQNEWRIQGVETVATPSDGMWKLSPLSTEGMQFMYPEVLPTKYITAQEWPPKVTLSGDTYSCTKGERVDTRGERMTTEERVVIDRAYCVAHVSEGAAGSTYTTYEYMTTQSDFIAHVRFTLRLPQCMNYSEPEQHACVAEQKNFDIDGMVDRIVSSVRIR